VFPSMVVEDLVKVRLAVELGAVPCLFNVSNLKSFDESQVVEFVGH
jgi:hypothetical protein